MRLRERFEEILDPTRLLTIKLETLPQECLEAVCTVQGHKWSYGQDGFDVNGRCLWKISGPCKVCGGRGK